MLNSSLQEYRFAFPLTAGMPTITQSRGLARVLARIEDRKAIRAQRKQRLQRISNQLRSLSHSLLSILAMRHARSAMRAPSLHSAHA